MNMAMLSTAGSAWTIRLSSSWCRSMSAKDMSCEVSDTAVRKPLSCCGKNPFGIMTNR